MSRITIERDKMGGVPCIRGLRIPVATVLRALGEGATWGDILADYPDLSREDIADALDYAADMMTAIGKGALGGRQGGVS